MAKRTLAEDFSYVFSLPTWPNQDFQLEARLVQAMEPKRFKPMKPKKEKSKLGSVRVKKSTVEAHYFRCGLIGCAKCGLYLEQTGCTFLA